MKRCMLTGESWQDGLLALRNKPIATGMLSPAQHIQGRLLHSLVPVDKSKLVVSGYDLGQLISHLAKVKDKYYHDWHAGTERSHLADEQTCYFKTGTGSWVPGVISGSVGERSYMIDGMDGVCTAEIRRISELQLSVVCMLRRVEAGGQV